MPILQTNELPIHEIKICHGWCGKQGHIGFWCPNEDNYAMCTYIETPKTVIAKAYAFLRESRMVLLDLMTLGETEKVKKLKNTIAEIKKIITVYEKYS